MHNLKDILELENLKKVWNIIREGISDDLIRDPLDYLAYETKIDLNLKQLRYTVLNDNYNPRSIIIVKSAKRDGLSRSLSFLEIEDLIVLKTICDYLQPHLHKDFPEYADFSRSLRTAFPKDASDYEGWFEHWLRHQNALNKMIAKKNGWEYIVFADISNFFPSINHAVLRQIISTRIEAEEKVINLLFYILESMIPKSGYCCDRKQGLPQENHDASRILAHTFLYHLDNIFKTEGEAGRYARWVDDIVVAVDSKPTGRVVLSKIQTEIESKGLFLNNSKCKIIEGEQALQELWLEENEYLDNIHQSLEEQKEIDIDEFDNKLKTFLSEDKKENWDRVLRRYYTESRRINSSYMEKIAFQHLNEYPSEASTILSYLEARPFSEEILKNTFEYLKNEGSCYQDVEILIYEFLMKWGIPNNDSIREACASLALDHFFGRNGFKEPLIDYVRGLITLFCYKVSGRPALEPISTFYKSSDNIQFLKYAFCCLAGTEDFKDIAYEKATTLEDISIRRLEKLFRDLENKSKEYSSLIKQFISPKVKKYPQRVILLPRVLPLIRICRRDTDFLPEWVKICTKTLNQLESPQDKSLHDHLSIAFLKLELTSA